MKVHWKECLTSCFEFLFLIFVASFFLTLGSDTLPQIYFRMVYGGFLLVGSFIFLCREKTLLFLKSAAALFFLGLMGFEVLRSLWAFSQIAVNHLKDSPDLPLATYLWSPLYWAFYFGFFILSYSFLKNRKRSERFLWVSAWCGFLLALNAIPPLLIKKEIGYAMENGSFVFFHPLFYFHPLISKYLLGRYAHPNYTGDVIALGFFPALALLIYSLSDLFEKRKRTSSVPSAPHSPILPATFAIATALATILFLSRGTTLCFTAGFLLFLLIAMVKFPSRKKLVYLGVTLCLVVGVLIWAADLGRTWKDLETLKRETNPADQPSFSTNLKGAQRALTIYQHYPFWGVGTYGYQRLSQRFGTPSSVENPDISRFESMCQYLQVLAEEGIGAFLYYLFILAYFLEVGWGLLTVKSRFQFLAGAGLLAAVFMILAHASINYLMSHFSASMLVYLFMGANLAVLRADFGHA